MTPWWTSHNGETALALYCGHVLDVLRAMLENSVHCVVTSPPYWGLRDYGLPPLVWGGDPACGHEWGEEIVQVGETWDHGPNRVGDNPSPRSEGNHHKVIVRSAFCRCGAWRGSLGLEPTPDLYVQHMVEVFQEVRRVLRRDGTVWLNLGDSYANDTKWGGATGGKHVEALHGDPGGLGRDKRFTGLKAKDLLGMPWRVAFALQQDGWYLRSDIIWAKPNPMPESVTDRPTKAHEYLFLLARSERYYYDADAIREPAEYGRREWSVQQFKGGDLSVGHGKNGGSVTGGDPLAGRNRRTVWEIATQPYPDAHFATFPEALVEPCVMAGTSERGCCGTCGAPWERETEDGKAVPVRWAPGKGQKIDQAQGRHGEPSVFYTGVVYQQVTVGWQPTCACDAAAVPATVLDPFAGSGTALLVSQRLGRSGIGIDLSENYCELARARLMRAHAQTRLLPSSPSPPLPEQLALIDNPG